MTQSRGRSRKTLGVLFILLSAFCFVAGMVISFALSTPTGPSVVAVNIICFCVFAALGRARALKTTARRANIR